MKSAESLAIQGVADFNRVFTNAKGRSELFAVLLIKIVSECNNSILVTMPLSEPPPAAFRHVTDTSEIHVELEHDV